MAKMAKKAKVKKIVKMKRSKKHKARLSREAKAQKASKDKANEETERRLKDAESESTKDDAINLKGCETECKAKDKAVCEVKNKFDTQSALVKQLEKECKAKEINFDTQCALVKHLEKECKAKEIACHEMQNVANRAEDDAVLAEMKTKVWALAAAMEEKGKSRYQAMIWTLIDTMEDLLKLQFEAVRSRHEQQLHFERQLAETRILEAQRKVHDVSAQAQVRPGSPCKIGHGPSGRRQ